MIISEMLTLASKYSCSLKTINDIVLNLPSYGKQEYICTTLAIDYKTFARNVSLLGISHNAYDLWLKFLYPYCYDLICSSISSELHIKKEHIEYNTFVQENIINCIAIDINGDIANKSIITLIQKLARSACRNYVTEIKNSSQNKHTFLGKLRGGLISSEFHVTNSEVVLVNKEVDSLKKVQGSDFKALLNNIYRVTPLFGFASQDQSVQQYTLFGCFINVYCKFFVENINKELRPYLGVSIDNTSGSEGVRKYRKYDKLIGQLLPFLVGDITKSNINIIAKVVCEFLFFERNSQTTFFLKGEDLSVSEGQTWKGNFELSKKFSKSDHAEKFTIFLQGLLSLHKLFKILERIGTSIFCIDADTFRFEDPSNKFSNLYELVKYSRIYCNLRRQYNLTNGIGFVLDKPISTYEVLPNNFGYTKKLLGKFLITWGDVPLQSALSYSQLSIQDSLRFLSKGLHPLLSLLDNFNLDKSYSEEERLSLLTQVEYLNGIYIENFYINEYDYISFFEELKPLSEDLCVLMEDLLPVNLNVLFEVEAFNNLLSVFNSLNNIISGLTNAPDSKLVSQFEISIACSQVGLSNKFLNFDNSLVGVDRVKGLIEVVLNIVGDKVSLTEYEKTMVLNIFEEKYISFYLSNLVIQIENLIEEIYLLSNTSNLMLDRLLDKDSYPSVVGERLLDVHRTTNLKVDLEQFSHFVQVNNLSRDADGYLLNKNGEYVLIVRDATYGYLHTMGVYIYNDCTAEVWRGNV